MKTLRLAGVALGVVLAGCTQVPPQLEIGHRLLAEATPDHISYQHRPTVVHLQSDAHHPAEAHADCSGLAFELLRQAHPGGTASLQESLRAKRPLARHFVDAIQSERGFKRIESVSELRPGDVLASQYTTQANDSGHVMIIDSPAELAPASWTPSGMTRYVVRVLDSTSSHHGLPDSRVEAGGKMIHTGLGTGFISLFARDGTIVTWAWGTSQSSRIYPADERPIVVGRYIAP